MDTKVREPVRRACRAGMMVTATVWSVLWTAPAAAQPPVVSTDPCAGANTPTTIPALQAWCRDATKVASACGQTPKRKSACQYVDAYKAYADKTHDTRRFFRAGEQTFDPQNQVTGPYTPYRFGDATFKNKGAGRTIGTAPAQLAVPATGFSAVRRQDRFAALQKLIADPRDHVKNTAYLADGTKIGTTTSTVPQSCDEYVYKAYYDWSRYEDAISACKGDKVCNFNIAYGLASNTAAPTSPLPAYGPNKAPRIAGRTLMSLDAPDQPLHATGTLYNDPPQQGQFALLSGSLPKNAWFSALAPYFATQMYYQPGDPTKIDPRLAWMAQYFDAKYAQDFVELAQTIIDGRVYYKVGAETEAGTNETYADEWAFHWAMRAKTAAITEAGSLELEKRTHRVEQLALKATYGISAPTQYKAGGRVYQWQKGDWVETLGSDPFERSQIFGSPAIFAARINAGAQAHTMSAHMPVPPGGAVLPGDTQAAPVALQIMPHATLTTPAPVKAPGWIADPASPTPRFLCTPATTKLQEATFRQPGQQSIGDPEAAGMARCELYNKALDEWFRMKRNRAAVGCTTESNCGCLQLPTRPGAPPAGGGGGFQQVPQVTRVDHAGYGCDWSPKMFTDRWVTPTRYVDARSKLDQTCKKYLNYSPKHYAESVTKMKALIDEGAKTLEAIKDLPNLHGKPTSFGQDAHDGATEGDTDFFAAYYAYDAGWQLDPAKLTNNTNDAKVCQLSGRLHGMFNAGVWLFGNNVRAVDADGWIIANDKNNRKISYETHLLVLGDEIFDPAIPSNAHSGDTYAAYPNGVFKTDVVNQVTGGKDAGKDTATLASASTWNTRKIPDPAPTITAGPCPLCVSGSVWATVGYGASLTPKATLDHGCDHETKDFGIDLVLQPQATFSADFEASVGIPIICSVGVFGELTLLDITLPVTTHVGIVMNNNVPSLDFSVGADLVLRTLGGRIGLDFQFFFTDTQVDIFTWAGEGPFKEQIVAPFHKKIELPGFSRFAVVNRASAGL